MKANLSLLTLESREVPGLAFDGIDLPEVLRPIRQFECMVQHRTSADGIDGQSSQPASQNLKPSQGVPATASLKPNQGVPPPWEGIQPPEHWISSWDPSSSELPSDYWPTIRLLPSSDGRYHWDSIGFNPNDAIVAVKVAPPIDPDMPYQLSPPDTESLDYGGYYTSSADGYWPNDVHLDMAPGIYTARINFASGNESTFFFMAGVAAGNGGDSTPIGRQVKVDVPGADLLTVPDVRDDMGFDNGFLRGGTRTILPRFGTEGNQWVRIQDGAGLRAQSLNKWEDVARAGNDLTGRPITETIIGHGSRGRQQFSTYDAWGGAAGNLQVAAFSSVMRGKVSQVNLFGCEVAWKGWDRPGGLMYVLGHALHTPNGPAVTVGAWDKVIYYDAPWLEDNGRFRQSEYYVDDDAVWRTLTVP
jgi:hypothetical protein